MAEIAKAAVPLAYEAFEDYILHARRFSRAELEIIRSTLTSLPTVDELQLKGLSAREAREFLDKLQ